MVVLIELLEGCLIFLYIFKIGNFLLFLSFERVLSFVTWNKFMLIFLNLWFCLSDVLNMLLFLGNEFLVVRIEFVQSEYLTKITISDVKARTFEKYGFVCESVFSILYMKNLGLLIILFAIRLI